MRRKLVFAGVGTVLVLVGLYVWYVQEAHSQYGLGMKMLEQGDHESAFEQLEGIAGRPLNPVSARAREGATEVLWVWFIACQEEADLAKAKRVAFLLSAFYCDSPAMAQLIEHMETWEPEDAYRLAQELRDDGHYLSSREILKAIARGNPEGEWGNTHHPQVAIASPEDAVEITEGERVTFTARVKSHWEPNERISVEWISNVAGSLQVMVPRADGSVTFTTTELSAQRDTRTFTASPTRHIVTLRATDSSGHSVEASYEVTVNPSIDVHVPVGENNQAHIDIGTASGTITSTRLRGPTGLSYQQVAVETGNSRRAIYQIAADSSLEPGSYWMDVRISAGGRQLKTQRLHVDVFNPGMTARVIPSVEPEVVIENKANRTITLTLTDSNNMVVELPAGATRTVTLKPGQTCYVASAPGVSSARGCHRFEMFTGYTWTFFIRTVYGPQVPSLPSLPGRSLP